MSISPAHDLRAYEYQVLDSTQTQAWRLVDDFAPKPFYVVAEEQTQGRGRLGRSWEAAKTKSLIVSLACELEVSRLQALSLGVGLFASEFFASLPLQLKWPNDLMLYDSKVGGILIESRIHGERAEVVIGIGINLDDIPHTSYRGVGVKVTASEFISFIYSRMREFGRLGFSAYRAQYEKRMWRQNQKITYLIGGEKKEVVVRGVDEAGQLLIEGQKGLELQATGEIALV